VDAVGVVEDVVDADVGVQVDLVVNECDVVGVAVVVDDVVAVVGVVGGDEVGADAVEALAGVIVDVFLNVVGVVDLVVVVEVVVVKGVEVVVLAVAVVKGVEMCLNGIDVELTCTFAVVNGVVVMTVVVA